MVAESGWPGVTTLAVHQLVPELADAVGRSDAVIFVDAGFDMADDVEVRELAAATSMCPGHASNPVGLLALSEIAYGRRPCAWLVMVRVETLAMGKRLSGVARRGVPVAVRQVRVLVERLRQSG